LPDENARRPPSGTRARIAEHFVLDFVHLLGEPIVKVEFLEDFFEDDEDDQKPRGE
jgi:hypothetical protein